MLILHTETSFICHAYGYLNSALGVYSSLQVGLEWGDAWSLLCAHWTKSALSVMTQVCDSC